MALLSAVDLTPPIWLMQHLDRGGMESKSGSDARKVRAGGNQITDGSAFLKKAYYPVLSMVKTKMKYQVYLFLVVNGRICI